MVQGLLDAQPPQQQAPGDFPHEGAIGERTPFTFGGGPLLFRPSAGVRSSSANSTRGPRTGRGAWRAPIGSSRV